MITFNWKTQKDRITNGRMVKVKQGKKCLYKHPIVVIMLFKSNKSEDNRHSNNPGGMGTMPEVTQGWGGGLLKKIKNKKTFKQDN
jgi:hypothetical protein